MERKTSKPNFVSTPTGEPLINPLSFALSSHATTPREFADELASYADHARNCVLLRMSVQPHQRRSELDKIANVWREVAALCRVVKFPGEERTT
jgi:hypothetical protein